MSPVLTTLKTDDINRLNNARSHTDGGYPNNRKRSYPNRNFPQKIIIFLEFQHTLVYNFRKESVTPDHHGEIRGGVYKLGIGVSQPPTQQASPNSTKACKGPFPTQSLCERWAHSNIFQAFLKFCAQFTCIWATAWDNLKRR